MPELPEVEIVRRGLSNLVVGKVIKSVDFDWPKSFPNKMDQVDEFVIGSMVMDVKRRAKVLIIDLSSGYSLLIHLKMTGQLVYRSNSLSFGAGHPTDSLVGSLPDSSTRVVFKFDDDSTLFFNDQRKFGWVKLINQKDLGGILSIYGPEPLEKPFNKEVLKAALSKRPNTAIKAALLDQKVIAGIGNIYADECLWEAKIHPLTAARLLSDQKIGLLAQVIKDVLSLAIKHGGSTDRNYVDALGQKGSYLKFANVFRKQGQSCPRCGHEIKKIRVAGRGTHYCPYCQRL
jgi:formamidopyrimidine-DNA glycosylase